MSMLKRKVSYKDTLVESDHRKPKDVRKGAQILVGTTAYNVLGRRFVAGWNVPERFQDNGHKNGWIFTIQAATGAPDEAIDELFVGSVGTIEVPRAS